MQGWQNYVKVDSLKKKRASVTLLTDRDMYFNFMFAIALQFQKSPITEICKYVGLISLCASAITTSNK